MKESKKEKLLEKLKTFKAWTCKPQDKKWTDEDEKAYQQIKETVKMFYSPLRHMIKNSPKEEWIRIKATKLADNIYDAHPEMETEEYWQGFIRSLVEEIQGK